jgi:predicted HAD superfamily Cof-like phosphohydrolase
MPDNDALAKAVLAAITDPGSVVSPFGELSSEWLTRAVLKAIGPFLAAQTPEQMLREFHSAAGLPLPDQPTARPELGSQTGRAKILAEEVKELGDAIDAGDITEIADACADVVYAVVGTAVTYGIGFDAVLREVHRSNMTKLIPPVQVNGDGKIVKGPGYEPPDIARVLGLGKITPAVALPADVLTGAEQLSLPAGCSCGYALSHADGLWHVISRDRCSLHAALSRKPAQR